MSRMHHRKKPASLPVSDARKTAFKAGLWGLPDFAGKPTTVTLRQLDRKHRVCLKWLSALLYLKYRKEKKWEGGGREGEERKEIIPTPIRESVLVRMQFFKNSNCIWEAMMEFT